MLFRENFSQFRHYFVISVFVRLDDTHEEFGITWYTKSEDSVDKHSHYFHMNQRAIDRGEVVGQIDLTSLLQLLEGTNKFLLLELLLVMSISIIIKGLSDKTISLTSSDIVLYILLHAYKSV